jgi:hypothetical protein
MKRKIVKIIDATKVKQEPEWAREKDITARFGMTHTVLYNLRKGGVIRSASIRTTGAKYGIRIFHVGSIRDFIEKQEAQEIAQQQAPEKLQA